MVMSKAKDPDGGADGGLGIASRLISSLSSLRLSVQSGTTGATLALTAGPYEPPPLVPAVPAITKPVRSYVYFHRDVHGRVFYVGMGQGRRAWAADRHPVWHRYVAERSAGQYTVEIFRDGLSTEEAEDLENEFVSAYGSQLVNWINGQRGFDYEKLAEFHRLRDANRARIAQARSLEKTDPDAAVTMYREAISHMASYARMQTETGLVAELSGSPCFDDSEALDRLTLVLARLGRHDELLREAAAYFEEYPEARDRCARGQRVQARVKKALAAIARP
jgi:hypothetical protein